MNNETQGYIDQLETILGNGKIDKTTVLGFTILKNLAVSISK